MPKPPPHHDVLVLHDGTTLNTIVLNKTFTIKTNFGTVTVKKLEIVHIVMQPGLRHELITTSADILKGQIRDKQLSVIISTGDRVSLKLPNDVLAIQFQDNMYPTIRNKIARHNLKRKFIHRRK